jgi:hypothetical protein
MRFYLLLVVNLTLIAVLHAQKLPVEEFSHPYAYDGAVLSPDGKALVYAEMIKGGHRLLIRDLETGKNLSIDLQPNARALGNRTEIYWATNQRLVFRAGWTYAAINRDGTNAIYSLHGSDVVHLSRNEKDGMMIMTGYESKVGDGIRTTFAIGQPKPFLLKVNPHLLGVWSREEDNPGNVVGWGVTPQGKVRAAVEIKGTQYRMLHRDSDKSRWEVLPGMDWGDPEARPLTFSADGQTFYVSKSTEIGTWGIYPYDLRTRSFGDPLLRHGKYDVIPRRNPAVANGLLLQMLIHAPKQGELLGVRYLTEHPQIHWFDAGMQEVQTALDQTLPGKINTITSMSDDLQRLTLLSWSDCDPGTYYLFDRKEQSLKRLFVRMPWIDPAKMAEMRAIRYRARDGQMINGYLTLPKDRGIKQLPLVLLPHDGLWRRDVWEFNPLVQLLANRGYAVLQMNYRGSIGYGEAFMNAGSKQLGAAVQNDIADGARWAIQQGLADPKRVAIVGNGSFAGYSALMNIAREPGLYCCGLSEEPYVDWLKLMDWKALNKEVVEEVAGEMIKVLGDPVKDADMLREMSLINLADRIKIPVQISHQKGYAGFKETGALVKAIEQHGGQVEFNTQYDEKFGYLNRAKRMQEIEAFLQKHMPADN